MSAPYVSLVGGEAGKVAIGITEVKKEQQKYYLSINHVLKDCHVILCLLG